MTDELPPLIDADQIGETGYVYIVKWEDYQHRDAVRSGPPMRWHKTLTAQLDHDEYRALSPSARGLLADLRTLTARMGQGRCTGVAQSLQRLTAFPAGHVQRNLVALNHAGFIELRAGKLPAACQQPAGTEKRRVGGAPTAHTPPRRTRPRAGVAEGAPATNGKTLVAGVELDPDTIRAMRGGYEPGWLTDQQIAAVQTELTEEPL